MQDEQPKGWTPIQDAQNAASFLVLAAQALAAPVEVCIRTKFGSRYFGVPSFLGFLIVPMWMLFWPESDSQPIFIFWCFYVLMQIRARIESMVLVARGKVVHSRYNGWPRLAVIFKKKSEKKLKELEPWLVIACGLLTLAFSEPLGSYLIVAGVALMCNGWVIESVERARAIQIHDALLEQQQMAQRVREIQERNGS